MLTRLLASKSAMTNAAKIRDIFVEMLERNIDKVKDKQKVLDVINEIKNKEYNNINDLIQSYKLILGLSEESLYNADLKINGIYQFPTNPSDKDLIDKILNIINGNS